MKTICCICKALKSDDGINDGKISHGLCSACEPGANKEIDDFIRNKTIKENKKEINNHGRK